MVLPLCLIFAILVSEGPNLFDLVCNSTCSLVKLVIVRFLPLVIDHNLGNRMLGQARPNSITQVMIYNLDYNLWLSCFTLTFRILHFKM